MTYKGLYRIWGPPGTGKTTRLAKSLRKIDAEMYDRQGCFKALVCSLTRTAAAEVAGRDTTLPREAIGTLHAHAYRSLGSPEIAETNAESWNEQHGDEFAVGGSTVDKDDPYARNKADTSIYEAYQLARAKGIDVNLAGDIGVRRFAKLWECWKQETGYIDFTDMISMALETVDTAPGDPSVILADEAQDHSAIEMQLLRKWGTRADALIIVGDPWQALYTWRGASPRMFTDKTIDAQDDILAQSYRVPRVVHAAAMKWIEQLSDFSPIEYAPRDADGDVSDVAATWRRPDAIINDISDVVESGRSVMLAASCGYMLRPIVAVLRRMGIPFSNPWQTKRGDWNPLQSGRGVSMSDRVVAFLSPLTNRAADSNADFNFGANVKSDTELHWTLAELSQFVGAIRSTGCIRRGFKTKIEGFKNLENSSDVRVTMANIAEWFEPDASAFFADMVCGRASIGDALCWLESRLSPQRVGPGQFPLSVCRNRNIHALRDKPKCYVGTIHSFKGAEADVVYLFPDLSPQGWRDWIGGDETRDGIIRMFYVGLTRAKCEVRLCRQSSSMSVSLEGII